MNTDPLSDFTYLQSDVERVRKACIASAQTPELVRTAADHLMNDVPKLVRPIFTLSASYFEGDRSATDRAIEAATAIELLHVGTLCHDDVMDESDTRRGRPSVNARWGNCVAILAGDFHLSRSAEISAHLGKSEMLIISRTLRLMCEGQTEEMAFIGNAERTEMSYFRSIAGKTAALIAAACEIGALQAGLDAARVSAYSEFGYEFGMAFQINDDILDLVQSSELLGKASNKDLVEGVFTLPVLRAIARDPGLADLIRSKIDRDLALKIGQRVVDSGAIEEAAVAMAEHMSRAEKALQRAVPNTDRLIPLMRFARGILNATSNEEPSVASSLHYGQNGDEESCKP